MPAEKSDKRAKTTRPDKAREGRGPVQFYRADGYRAEQSLGFLLKRIIQSIVRQADKRLSEHGLTHAQWSPLIRLHFGGPSTAAALAADLDIDAGALSRLLDRLEAKGLCQRERSSTDRRVVTVDLSAAGRQITNQLPAVLSDVFNAHLDGFSREEWQTLLALLGRVLANGELLRAADEDIKT